MSEQTAPEETNPDVMATIGDFNAIIDIVAINRLKMFMDVVELQAANPQAQVMALFGELLKQCYAIRTTQGEMMVAMNMLGRDESPSLESIISTEE